MFICYKETDANGRRTPDSVLATELYHELTKEGFKVFFSRITLEDKLGTAYEPYIFAALHSSKVMVALGTKPEHFNAVWVKNEWSRYLSLIKAGEKKTLIPAYKDMDPYDLPEEFSHLQAQDMSKLGFMQDLLHGIKKILGSEAKPVQEKVVVQSAATAGANVTALIERGFMALEDGEWDRADGFFEEALNQDAKNAECYLGKLMAELNIRKREELNNAAEPFDDRNNCVKACRFDEKLRKELSETNDYISRRNEATRKEAIYQKAIEESKKITEKGYIEATVLYTSIPGYKDADERADECRKKAVKARNESLYKEAVSAMSSAKTESEFKATAETFKRILDYKDSDDLAEMCLDKAEICRKDVRRTVLTRVEVLVGIDIRLGIETVLLTKPCHEFCGGIFAELPVAD
ncbi:MAG: TIR domain-containing protein, partial [Clostridiales bacterium]|nr:TIR domain-containing protein [Clostridiales bacterium]